MEKLKSEDTKEIVNGIVSKLPISALVLVITLIVSEFGLYKIYSVAKNQFESNVIVLSFVVVILFVVYIATITYKTDFKYVAEYAKSQKRLKTKKSTNP